MVGDDGRRPGPRGAAGGPRPSRSAISSSRARSSSARVVLGVDGRRRLVAALVLAAGRPQTHACSPPGVQSVMAATLRPTTEIGKRGDPDRPHPATSGASRSMTTSTVPATGDRSVGRTSASRRPPIVVFPLGGSNARHEEPPIATPPSNTEPRINDRIRAREVRLVGPDGAQIGIKPLPEALAFAREHDLDLVEVAAMANPPVCRIMDYGKYKYEAAQQAKESRRKSTAVAIKEMKYRPKIGIGDFDTKTRQVEKFLGQGHKVKVTIMFRGREMQHPELGQRILERVAEAVAHVGQGRGHAEARRSQHGDGAGAGQAGQGGVGEGARPKPDEPPPANGSGGGRRRRRRTTAGRQETSAMPKMKTHKGAAKRFKVTGSGKITAPQGLHEPHPREEVARSGSAASAGDDRGRRRRPRPHRAPARPLTAPAHPARTRRRRRAMARVKRSVHAKKKRRVDPRARARGTTATRAAATAPPTSRSCTACSTPTATAGPARATSGRCGSSASTPPAARTA